MTTEKMNQEDQATQLKKLINDVQNHDNNEEAFDKNENIFAEHLFLETEDGPKIDVLNLPPRKEVHSENRMRTKLKIGRPMIRLIFVFTLLALIIAAAYYFWGEEVIAIINNL